MSILNYLMLLALAIMVVFGVIDFFLVIKRLKRIHRENKWKRITINATEFWRDKQ